MSGDVGLMILWLFDAEDEDANGLSEKKGARKTKRCLRSLLVSGQHAPVQVS